MRDGLMGQCADVIFGEHIEMVHHISEAIIVNEQLRVP